MAFPAKKKGPDIDLAVIMGGPPKGKSPMGEEPEGDESAEMSSEDGESSGAFDVAFEEFNDSSLSPEDRKAAFKRAVMACMEGEH